jgi:hypothetical protein
VVAITITDIDISILAEHVEEKIVAHAEPKLVARSLRAKAEEN